MNSLLIYDNSSTGHHFEFLKHLIDHISLQKIRTEFVFLVHPDLLPKLEVLNTLQCKFIPTEASYKSLYEEFNLITRTLIQYNCNKVIFMQLDGYVESFLGVSYLSRLPCSITGILFRSCFRFPKNSLKPVVKRFRNLLLLKYLVFKKKNSQLFVLNDAKSAEQYNLWFFKKNIFYYLPDPLYVNTPIEGHIVEASDNNTLLICGSIDFRKNVKNILKSIDFLKPEMKNVIKIRIVGKVKDYYMEEFNHEVAEFRSKHRDVKIDIENQLVSDEYLHDSIASATIVMIPYIAFYASSGILGKAANYGIPVISSSKGVLGDLVKQYHLGEVTDEESPEAIAEAIYKCLKSKDFTHFGFKKYLHDKSPSNFANILLG